MGIQVNMHCTHKYVSLFPALNHCFALLDARSQKHETFRLKETLFLIGGMQQKTMNEEDLDHQIECLQQRGIEYSDPGEYGLRSLFEVDYYHTLDLLLDSTQFRVEKVREPNVCKPSYRLFGI